MADSPSADASAESVTEPGAVEAGASERLLLIDGHSMAFRAFYGLPVENFSTSTGQATNAVYGFVSMLINLIRDEQPTHIGVAFDVSRTTFRTREYADYKGTRDETPAPFIGQVDLIKDVLDALAIVYVEKADFEADDIIATLSAEAGATRCETLICSGDRDSFQLIDERTTVLYPRRGATDLARMTPAAVEEKYGVPPARYPELAALVGETSDNLPGVPGVGPKTAAKWLGQFDGLENLLAEAETVKGKAGESLRAHLDDVRRNRRLNALVRDVSLPVDVAGLRRRPGDAARVQAVFDALEFRQLRSRVAEIIDVEAAPDEPAGQELVVDGVVLAPGEVAAWLRAHEGEALGVVWTGRWARGSGDITACALASSTGAAAWFDVAEMTPDDDAAFAAWLTDSSCDKVVHQVKGPLEALWTRGWDLTGATMDTRLAAYLIRPDQRDETIAQLTSRYLGFELAGQAAPVDDQPALDFDGPGVEADAERHQLMREARALLALRDRLTTVLAERDETALLEEVELPLTRVLATMERTGVAVDRDFLDSLCERFDRRVRDAAAAAYDVIGHEVNLSSPQQLQKVLFDELGLPKTKKTKTGYTTNADALEKLFASTENPFLAHLLEHRDAIKLRQIVEGLVKTVADDDRIHTTFMQTATATGRLSSVDPNLQNIPIRSDEGRQIRRALVPGPGFASLLSADYSQIEMRLMAHASGDERLIAAFRSGEDFHRVMAAHVFGGDPAEVTATQRARIKAMNYGLAYGLSSYGLSAQLGISVREADQLSKDYFAVFGHVRDYLHSLVDEARAVGYTSTILGRRRYLPDLTSPHHQLREMAERMALNAPIQGSAADIIKVAMIAVDRRLAETGLASRMLLQVHDELVFEVAPGEEEALEALVRQEMEHAIDLDVPLDVSVGVGPSWADAH
ncbi:MAG: DNA polymerase I [Propionibacteriaceae bacterium]|jgi:DNA polymerase-1|nr:DNA polymerase I [Propionibacteriaceae bacterium]